MEWARQAAHVVMQAAASGSARRIIMLENLRRFMSSSLFLSSRPYHAKNMLTSAAAAAATTTTTTTITKTKTKTIAEITSKIVPSISFSSVSRFHTSLLSLLASAPERVALDLGKANSTAARTSGTASMATTTAPTVAATPSAASTFAAAAAASGHKTRGSSSSSSSSSRNNRALGAFSSLTTTAAAAAAAAAAVAVVASTSASTLLVEPSNFVVECAPAQSGGGGGASLALAARYGDASRVKALLNQGADPDDRHPYGWTALHVAAVQGDAATCQVLINNGADPDATDNYVPARDPWRTLQRQEEFSDLVNPLADTRGFTALHYAVLADNKAVVAALIAANADPTATDAAGHVPLDYVRTSSTRPDGGNNSTSSRDLVETSSSDENDVRAMLEPYITRHAEQASERRAKARRARDEAGRRHRRENPLELQLKAQIVGQEGPINAVCAAVRRRLNGWHDEDHPLVFLFLGSSGVGKTELAKRLAECLDNEREAEAAAVEATTDPSATGTGKAARKKRQRHHRQEQRDAASALVDGNRRPGDERSQRRGFIRLDMSEYQEKHEAAKLIGSPPGYVGHDEGGQLTRLLRESPDAVVLLDEVEKAHPDVLTVMLQLFDEGRLTDGQGRTIDCRSAIFVMTSNLAAREIADHAWSLRQQTQALEEARVHNGSSNTYASNGGVNFESIDTNSSSSSSSSSSVGLSQGFKEQVIRPILKAHFQRDEFLGRVDEFLYFVPFTTPELYQLVELQLKKWANRARERHDICVEWDESVLSFIAAQYDVHYGARSLQHAVERDIVNQLAAAHENEKLMNGGRVVLSIHDGQVHLEISAQKEARGWFS